jgi:hypothetical protein
VTQKKCNQKYPPQVQKEVVEKIITRDSIVYKDRVVEIKVPADTVYVEKIVEIPVNVYIAPITAENDYARASAWIEKSKIRLMLTQKEQVITTIIENAEKEAYYWKEKYLNERIVETVTVKYTPKVYKVALLLWVIAIFGFIMYTLFKLGIIPSKNILRK